MAKRTSNPRESRVVLIAGDEDVLRRDALRTLIKDLGVNPDDMDVETVIADQRQPAEWAAAASSVPFLSERRIVVVRNVLRVNPAEEWDEKPKSKDHPFVKQLAALPETAMLVLVADDEMGDEEKMRRLEGVARRWTDLVGTAEGFVFGGTTTAQAIQEEMRKIATAAGKHLTPASASLIAEMTGGSLSIARAEMAKVVAYVGANENIHDSDVRAAVAPEQDYNVYQLVDAVVAGDSGGALRQLRTLTSRNDKIEGQAFSRVFPTLAKQFRLIWQARLCLDANCRPSDPTPAVLAMMPSKPRIDNEKDWVQKRAMGSARRLSLGQVRRVFAELGDADAKIKGLAPSYSTQETVEEMVLKMAAVCRSK
ncbi:MAG: DNA polymerase III subunit delta [Fimbriimonadaceae bacterium]